MAWSYLNVLVGGGDKTSGTTTAHTTAATCAVGSVVLIAVAFDEIGTGTTDGDPAQVTGIADDSGGSNVYVKLGEFANMQTSAAADGAVVSVWYSILTTSLVAATHTVTITFSAATTAKGVAAANFGIAAGSTISVAATQTAAGDAVDPASQTIGGLSGEHLYVHAIATEGPGGDNFTESAGIIGMYIYAATSGGADDSNMGIWLEWRILTGTGFSVDVASNTADRDHAQLYLALLETLSGGVAHRLSLLGVGA